MTVSVEMEIGVRRLHALCTDAVWRRDPVAFGECYTADGIWKIAGLEFQGRDAIGRALTDLGAGNERVLMMFGSPILDLADGVLTARTYTVEQVKLLDGGGSATVGIYYERFVEQDGRWLFQWRHFDFCYLGPPDLSAPFFPFQDYGPAPALPGGTTATAGLRVGD
ncbi:nuclear transport factor 2 family protein [Novosphingobium album (ex Hu et al. 2023)]|uniref:Nuclear transport factor 2 family protein n=1 Tax=Novosphingobium album (ex Hu et al. 2023) TaxID=2930093 RepID=A0ABT0B7R9_9SPHN|nr:nuclear transport factor 2 family protein [Novosphingobium album (ex Hu et al. 2023)]MCJ2180869.1 nuclear transport factor 2 family protein [Novosphingobium album (ex Hu et al. 2023)]